MIITCDKYLINTVSSLIAELSYWRLMVNKTSNDIITHSVTYLDDRLEKITHLNVSFELNAWRQMLQKLARSAVNTLNQDSLFELPAVSEYSPEVLHDNVSKMQSGHFFLNDLRNHLQAVKDWLFHQVRATLHLMRRFVRSVNSDSQDEHENLISSLWYHPGAIGDYMQSHQVFLKQLAVLIYMSAGLPSRRSELMEIKWCNIETARNIYVNGLVTIITDYSKNQWRVGTRPVA